MKLLLQRFFPILGVAAALYLGVILAQTVKQNHDLQNNVTKLEDQVSKLVAEQEELKYKVQYYQTESYKEKEARAKLGLQAPGEGVIYLPKAQPTAAADAAKPAKAKSNIGQWLEFLFG
jgi:cell division protein FtsB